MSSTMAVCCFSASSIALHMQVAFGKKGTFPKEFACGPNWDDAC
jgi:hypothetical protein